MRTIMRMIRRLFLRDWGVNLIHEVRIYPLKLRGNTLDCRMPENKPYMLVSFNYIREPEKDERIIHAVEKEFKELPEFEGIKFPYVREVLTSRQDITTLFKEKISLS